MSASNSKSSVSALAIERESRIAAHPLFPRPSSASNIFETRFSLRMMLVRPSITMYFACT